MSNNGVHDKRVKKIIRTPGIIGLDNIVLSAEEANIFSQKRSDKGRLLGQPDGLMFDPTTKTLYHLEYKCSDRRDDAFHQLSRNGRVLKGLFNSWEVVGVYVHGRDYETEMRKYDRRS